MGAVSSKSQVGQEKKVVDKEQLLQKLEEYRILLENMGEGLAVLNKNMVPIFVNNKLCEILACDKDDILGKKVPRVTKGESRNRIRDELKKRAKGRSSIYTIRVRTKQGKEIFLSISGVPLFDKKGKFKASIAIISDITERKKLEDKLRERTTELEKEVNKRTELLVDLYKGVALTAERNRLARDIHDFCAQSLASSLLKIELCEKLVHKHPEEVKRELKELRRMLAKSIKSTQNVIFGLRLPDFHRTGFTTVLRQYFEEFCRKTGIVCRLNLKLQKSLPVRVQVGIYRIIRETMNNIRKHAAARRVDARLRTDKSGNLYLVIEDDGKGFDLNRALTQSKYVKHFGLKGMEEQAKLLGGALIIKTAKGQGTRIKVKVPLKE